MKNIFKNYRLWGAGKKTLSALAYALVVLPVLVFVFYGINGLIFNNDVYSGLAMIPTIPLVWWIYSRLTEPRISDIDMETKTALLIAADANIIEIEEDHSDLDDEDLVQILGGTYESKLDGLIILNKIKRDICDAQ